MNTQEKDDLFFEIFIYFKRNNLSETSFDYSFYFDGISLLRMEEFKPSSNFEKLCKKINNDKNNLSLKADIKTIHRLNKLLKIPNLYDILCNKKSNSGFSKEVEYFVNRTNGYRSGWKFSKLSIEEQITIKLLNRLLIEEIYPQETPSIKNELIKFIECETNPEKNSLKCSPVVLEKIKILKKVINNQNILKQIEKLSNPKRCVVIEDNGSKKDLVHGIVSYIYCTHTYGELSDDDWTGWNENRPETSVLYDPWEGKEIEINKYISGNTLFLKNLEGDSTNTFKQLAAVINCNATGKHGMLIISMPSADNLPEEFIRLSEIIELEPNKQKKMLEIPYTNSESGGLNSVYNIPTKPTIGSGMQDGNETLYFDDETNLLWFSTDKKTSLEPKDADILRAMIDIIKRKNRHFCRREEILLKAYKVNVSTNQRLPKENNTLTTAISTINTKCKEELSMKNYLIQRDGLRMIKFSRNIEIRKL